MNVSANNSNQKFLSETGSTIALPVNELNAGNTSTVSNKEMITAMETKSIASLINCLMMDERKAPVTFRTPISFALLIERAVVRFMKLMHAISKIITATMLKICMYS